MKIKMSDSRTIVGNFLCTDRHLNIILGSSLEYLKDGEYSSEFFIFLLFSNSLSFFVSEENEEPRMLGLAMIPGEHIVSIHIDDIRAGKKAKKEKGEEEEEEDQEEDDEVMEESTAAAEEA